MNLIAVSTDNPAVSSAQIAKPPHSVYAIYETEVASDDYRAFSYLMRIEETLPGPINVLARILGRYRGPRLRSEAIKAKGKKRGGKSPHQRGLGRVRRHVLSRFRLTPGFHWFSNIDANLYSALRWMKAWNQRDSKAVIFAHNLERGLKLVELVFLFAAQVPEGIVLVILGSSRLDPAKLATLRRWGVTVLLDGSEILPSQAKGSEPLAAYEFDSLVERPLLVRKCPSADWADILLNSELKVRNPEKVLFYRPDWMKCGSATTFAKLSKLYQKRGSILIDVALQPHAVFCGRSEIAIKLAEVEEDLAPSFHLNLRRSSLPVSMAKIIFHMVLKRPRTIAGYMPIFYRQCTVPRAVQMLIKTARIDYLYVNHYFTLPLAKSMKPDVPVFLDTHDIQSLNYISHDYHQRISMRAAPFTECLKEELDIVDVADRVTMVSREEIELFHQYRPNNEYFYYIPIPEAFSQSPRARDPRPSQSPLQALIVASRNPANERSLAWFLKAVWPKVAELPYQLTIVGNINRSFETYSHPKVTFAGLVEDLEAAYNQADLIILPITNGGGIAIKTLEAIQAELPIVCTRHAMRGLPVQVQSLLPGTLTSSELVDDLTRLISSSEALTSRRQQVRMAHQALVSVNFDEQMNHELDLICARSRS
jgi:glycosyltransferase involved in cell wall biosynthesis